MSPNISTDPATIAKRMASVCYGSSSTGPGSYFNPEARTDNCIFVSLGVVVGLTAPELSRRTKIPQPSDGSGGMEEDQIKRLLIKMRSKKLVSGFLMSDKPFDYNEACSQNAELLVLYVTPSGSGHCVVAPGRDFQHCNGRFPTDVAPEIFRRGFQDCLTGRDSICFTVLVQRSSAGRVSSLLPRPFIPRRNRDVVVKDQDCASHLQGVCACRKCR